jgi:sterol desaturase/sphingolipid hydroxylase (fatty acid hydroxylase superfamily)
MLHQKKPIHWVLELSWQFMFYSIPYWVDLRAVLEWFCHKYCGGDYKSAAASSILISINVGWFIPSAIYGILYFAQIPFFEQYRCQDWVWNQDTSKRRTQYMEVVKSTVISLFLNQLGLTLFIRFLCNMAMSHTDDQEHVREWLLNVPSATEGFIKMMVSLMIFETVFYWSHIWLHSPSGYRYHKDHHAFYTPMALAGHWGSTVDGLVSLPLPAFAPVFLLGIHPTTLWFYSIIHTCHSSYDHCGYDFPFNPFQLIPFGGHAQAHNFHHSHNIDNFGLYWRFWDVVMGTNKHWERFCAKRDALIEKLQRGEEAIDDDYVIRDGVMLLRCVAEEADIKNGNDNLDFTFQYTLKSVDEEGNIISGKEAAAIKEATMVKETVATTDAKKSD